VNFQEEVHLLTRQLECGGDLFRTLAAPVHAQRVGAFVQVESGLWEAGQRRYERVFLKIV
jgi:hypothetical protein